eukprot:TRINITY_DN19466_c0_g1_i1.p1 TRINITY_DN19466_c0_g1~~TRINITY_DN19466_c0_g1_i1.p1  ORF type:complete len:1321 (-),score=340.44 TRINITY_DN19466_c0_g1_i1:185-3640(-)
MADGVQRRLDELEAKVKSVKASASTVEAKLAEAHVSHEAEIGAIEARMQRLFEDRQSISNAQLSQLDFDIRSALNSSIDKSFESVANEVKALSETVAEEREATQSALAELAEESQQRLGELRDDLGCRLIGTSEALASRLSEIVDSQVAEQVAKGLSGSKEQLQEYVDVACERVLSVAGCQVRESCEDLERSVQQMENHCEQAHEGLERRVVALEALTTVSSSALSALEQRMFARTSEEQLRWTEDLRREREEARRLVDDEREARVRAIQEQQTLQAERIAAHEEVVSRRLDEQARRRDEVQSALREDLDHRLSSAFAEFRETAEGHSERCRHVLAAMDQNAAALSKEEIRAERAESLVSEQLAQCKRELVAAQQELEQHFRALQAETTMVSVEQQGLKQKIEVLAPEFERAVAAEAEMKTQLALLQALPEKLTTLRLEQEESSAALQQHLKDAEAAQAQSREEFREHFRELQGETTIAAELQQELRQKVEALLPEPERALAAEGEMKMQLAVLQALPQQLTSLHREHDRSFKSLQQQLTDAEAAQRKSSEELASGREDISLRLANEMESITSQYEQLQKTVAEKMEGLTRSSEEHLEEVHQGFERIEGRLLDAERCAKDLGEIVNDVRSRETDSIERIATQAQRTASKCLTDMADVQAELRQMIESLGEQRTADSLDQEGQRQRDKEAFEERVRTVQEEMRKDAREEIERCSSATQEALAKSAADITSVRTELRKALEIAEEKAAMVTSSRQEVFDAFEARIVGVGQSVDDVRSQLGGLHNTDITTLEKVEAIAKVADDWASERTEIRQALVKADEERATVAATHAERCQQEVESLGSQLLNVEERLEHLNQSVDGLRGTQSATEDNLKVIMQTAAEAEQEQAELKIRIDSLQTSIDSFRESEAAMSERISVSAQQIAAVVDWQAAQQAKTEVETGRAAELSRLETLETRVGGVEDVVSTLQESLQDLSSKEFTRAEKVNELAQAVEDVTKLQQVVEEVKVNFGADKEEREAIAAEQMQHVQDNMATFGSRLAIVEEGLGDVRKSFEDTQSEEAAKLEKQAGFEAEIEKRLGTRASMEALRRLRARVDGGFDAMLLRLETMCWAHQAFDASADNIGNSFLSLLDKGSVKLEERVKRCEQKLASARSIVPS